MKRALIALAASLVLSAAACGAEGPFGVGIVVGEPTGISLAYRPGGARMLQGAAAWDLTSPGGLTFTGDYLFLFDKSLKLERRAIPLYVGVGGKLSLLVGGSEEIPLGLGFRVPLGVRWPFDSTPLEAFLELVPGLRLIPDTAFDAGAGLGLRWYFKRK